MPMSWDAAADAKLFTVVMAVYDIKISGAQNEKIAKMMGEDVTPKAITHRLSKIKAQAASFSHTAPGTPASSRKRPSTPSSSAKTPGSKKGKGAAGSAPRFLGPNGKMLSATNTFTTLMSDDGQDDEENFDTPTKSRIKTERGSSKKRKMTAPKIEDFVGYAEDEGEDEGMADAIDFSLAYAAEVKMEEDVEMQMQMQQDNNKDKGKGKQKAEVVDLTEAADTIHITDELCHQGTPKGKGKAKEYAQMGGSAANVKVKKEVVDTQDVYEDEDGEMVV